MATFLCYGDIIDSEDKTQINEGYPTVTSKDVINFLEANKDAKEITVRINSRGGSVQEGFLIYDLLRNSGKKITTIGEGKIYSIATVIFLAGDERVMLENADGLIHMPFIPPNTLADAYDSIKLEKLSEALKQEEEKILSFYVDRTGTDKEKLRNYMSEETMLSASDMVTLGFATTIQQPLKAVAYFNLKQKTDMTENQEKTFDGLLGKLEKFVNSFSRISPKNMDMTDVNGNAFTVIREEGDIAVGDEASPDGNYTLEDGSIVVIEGGKIASITPSEPEESEEMKALKAENEELKKKVADMEVQAQAIEVTKNEAETLISELKNLKSSISIQGRQQSFKSTDKADVVDINKVKENLEKLKKGGK
jgi:ATP-dependent protease ClpP protease subunit